MITIKEILEIDQSKVENPLLLEIINKTIDNYKVLDDKEAFERHSKHSLSKLHDLIQKIAPQLLDNNDQKSSTDDNQQKEKEVPKKKETSAKKAEKKQKPSESFIKDIEDLKKDITACRAKIRAYNAERRKNMPEKPKPTRYDKIKSHFISIINLIPEKLKDDADTLKKAERLMLRTHRSIIDIYGMSQLKADKNEKAIIEKYDNLEEKAKKNNEKDE